jgi:membrane protein
LLVIDDSRSASAHLLHLTPPSAPRRIESPVSICFFERVGHSLKRILPLLIQLLKETVTSWMDDKAPRMGAALAYYTAFSLAPLLALAFSVVSLLYSNNTEAAVKQHIYDQANSIMGKQAADAVQLILAHTASTKSASWGAVVSVVILLFSASSAFGELQDSLNQIWKVPPQKQAFLALIRQRLLSFAMVLILGFFMLVSLVASALTEMVAQWIVVPFPQLSLEVANDFLSFFIFAGLFATMFRLLPDTSITWRDVGPGALFSAALFIIGKQLLAWYIGRSTTFSSYGAARSFVVILLWVYYSAQILYLGAEFTRAYTKRYGSHREAIPVKA